MDKPFHKLVGWAILPPGFVQINLSSNQLKGFASIFLLFVFWVSSAQVFHDRPIQLLVKKAANHVYNASEDSAFYYIDQVEAKLPNHPVVPLLKAMTLLWANIPTISGSLFQEMESYLDLAIAQAKAIDPDLEQPEMIFFSMASYGILAEYYADQGYNLKAVGEASRAYGLMKKGFKIVDEYPEFLLTTGLYNYLREKYPEKHPVYKPLVWFFRSGDVELGLEQLQQACDPSIITHVEAYVYLSYIYLRYEYKPKKAQEYLATLIQLYPNNYYAKAKYLESMANPEDFKDAPIDVIYTLMRHKNPYYKLAGNVFLGYFEEQVVKSSEKAAFAYERGLSYGEKIPDHGEYFKSLGYLRLGKILKDRGEVEEAEEMLKLSIKYAETRQIKNEARSLLSEI